MGKIAKLQAVNPAMEYITSAAFDSINEVVWLAIAHYYGPGQLVLNIRAINITTMSEIMPYASFYFTFEESDPVLAVGREYINNVYADYLYVAGNGLSKVARYHYGFFTRGGRTDFAADLVSVATVDKSFWKIGSMVYLQPYVYWSTFEPDAKLVRINTANFRPGTLPCGPSSYYNGQACTCYPGFARSKTEKDANGELKCKPGVWIDVETRVTQEVGAVAALATLLAFSIVLFIVGWVLWWRARRSAYQSL